MRERFEQRLFRIFAQAGYSPVQLLTVTPEEMVEIPGITVPNIRAVLCVQNKVLADRNKIRSGRLVEELLKEAGRDGRCAHERAAYTGRPGGPARLLHFRPHPAPFLRRMALSDLCRMEENAYPLSQWQEAVRYLTGDERDFASVKEIKAFILSETEAKR
ncbi:MAG: hypothetical protein V8Q30_09380 [Acutalibacteraceae bacterium]